VGAHAEALLDSYGVERKAHVRELTSRIKHVGAVICERDLVKARERDAAMLAQCGGVVKDTPRQDILPQLAAGLLAPQDHPARGSLFPQPWLLTGPKRLRMDTLAGNGWRLVLAPGQATPASAAALPWLRTFALGTGGALETDGVAEGWLQRHQCVAALVRPDNYVYGVAGTAYETEELLGTLATQLGAGGLWGVKSGERVRSTAPQLRCA
jgi:3-(3-hydroxy-phenyl)propionate hydroxylase